MTQYFTNDYIKSVEKTILVKIKNQDFEFKVDNGVFSKKGLDFGTRTLLENLPELRGNILDFGCGYGPIGIYIAKTYNCNVDMIDINNRSLSLAVKNSKINNVKTTIFASDIYANVTKKYDYIITNPPIRVGNTILFQILLDAKKYLKKGGELWLVINKNQGAKTIYKTLENHYNTSLITKNKGFYIIRAQNI